MKRAPKNNQKKIPDRVYAILFSFLLVLGIGAAFVFATGENADVNKLQNGSFEEGQTFTGAYSQPNQNEVPDWNTTAFEGKIELLRDNPNTYLQNPSIRLTPTDGNYAAELNADEESTLYQTVKTSPSSIYEWGLDHGARNGTDIMALVIGPNQSVDPSKPSKAGRDQFMQMIDWLKKETNIDYENAGTGVIYQKTVYSKKFAADGTFADNAGNNAFSLTPSTIYTEEWHIWIISDNKGTDTTKPNPWGKYGSNAESNTNSVTPASNTSELNKYYHYTVPSGQTKTLFAFVSVGYLKPATSADKAKTYGNFLDNINFEIYHPLSGSTTTHGSAVIGGSDGTAEGEGSKTGHTVTVGSKLTTYITDGEALKIQAVIKNTDAVGGCEFVGVYHTEQDENGNPVTAFVKLAGNEIEDTGSLTDEEKKGKWIKSTNLDGDTIYTYYLEGVTSATDLHFVFIKNPTVTYDPNGGKPYVVERTYNTDEADNVYSFKPARTTDQSEDVDTTTGATPKETFISPYVSKAAEGQNDGWKFMGWLLTGDQPVDGKDYSALGTKILPAIHTVACNYSLDSATQQHAAQDFKVYNGNPSTTKTIHRNDNDSVKNVTWDTSDSPIYNNMHKGLTMVAQWRWRQAFIPQSKNPNGTYTNSDGGGTVKITSVTNESDENYNAAYNTNGGKSYHATTDETITVEAQAKENCTFEGWYDADGNLVTTNTTYSYTQTKENVATYYARFSGTITQTYIRQVKNGDDWTNTEDDKIGTLGRYTYTDAPGTSISSTATAGSGYKFVGWYDSEGNKVADNMLINNGATISYETTVDATYYARFEKTYTVKFAAQTKQKDGTFKTDTVGGKVSVASVSDVANATASSKATANATYKFLGWYDKNGNQLSTNTTYSPTITAATNGVTYYARFEIKYVPTVDSKAYLSFVAESELVGVPDIFNNRDTGAGVYGLATGFGNTISTGFKYSLNTFTNVDTIQITVNLPASAYVKVGGTGKFSGDDSPILTDTPSVTYNRGSIQKISGATTLTYYWSVKDAEMKANTKYGFVIDNLYAPGATATITVNGTAGTEVTSTNGVVNTASTEYRGKSHYPK